MAIKITLPKLTHDMQAGTFVEWYKKEGDSVQVGDVIYAIETDKATAEVEAEAAGIIAGVQAHPGDQLAVGAVLAYLLAPGEPVPETVSPAMPVPEHQPPSAAPVTASGTGTRLAALDDPGAGGRVVSTPLARRTAREMHVDLQGVVGSGPRGRIVRADVLHAAQQRDAEAEPTRPYVVADRTAVQQRTALRLTQMWQTTPQFVLDLAVDMTEAVRWHRDTAGEMSYTSLLVRAVGLALGQQPQVNSLLVEGELRRYLTVNIGVAMATQDGLVVPVIHGADNLAVREIQSRLTALRARAEAGRLDLAEMTGGTFTISNLGMVGVDAFTAVINPPQVAILACGRVVEMPVVSNGQVVGRPTLHLRLTVDHRALDGAQAAPFLTEVKRLLETPYLLL